MEAALPQAQSITAKVLCNQNFRSNLEKLDNYLQFNSIIDVRMENLEDNLKTVADKRLSLESRIASLTERYARQYSAMESTVAQFQETGNMLTQLLEQKD